MWHENTIAGKISAALTKSWEDCCKVYVTETMKHLAEFKRITDELLVSQGFFGAEHRNIRDQLRPMLPDFENAMARLREELPNIEMT